MDEEGNDALALSAVLLGAHAPLDHRVHPLEVAGVEGEGQMYFLPAGGRDVGGVAVVVLHVAAADEAVGVLVVEGGEGLAHVLAEDVDHHVEAAAVGHPDDDLLDALGAGVLDAEVEHGDHALATLEGEALGADVILVDELLEDLGVGQLREHAQRLLARELRAVLRSTPSLLAASGALRSSRRRCTRRRWRCSRSPAGGRRCCAAGRGRAARPRRRWGRSCRDRRRRGRRSTDRSRRATAPCRSRRRADRPWRRGGRARGRRSPARRREPGCCGLVEEALLPLAGVPAGAVGAVRRR